jgi:hypothetical protein
LLPAIPLATDLPSMIRAVNIMRDILRTLTTSLTVNNVWEQQFGNVYRLSPYPAWQQVGTETVQGYVYYKAKGKEPDKDQRAYVLRINSVEFRNNQRDKDQSFFWRLKKAPDSEYGESNGIEPYHEDFFERIVNVKWSTPLAVEFGDRDGGPPPDSDNAFNKKAAPVA